jgi:hypothetical protein
MNKKIVGKRRKQNFLDYYMDRKPSANAANRTFLTINCHNIKQNDTEEYN